MESLIDDMGGLIIGGNNYSDESKRNRMRKMLSGVPAHLIPKIKWDDEASWSFTDLRIGRDLCKKILTLPGISSTSTITDATASVGGNTIAFAGCFKHVNSIELDPGRKTMLDHNVKLLGLSHVTTYQGYSQEFIYKLKQDVIFFDPPWGTDYKRYESGTLLLKIGGPGGSKQTFESLVKSTRSHTKYCVVKLPINYNIDHLTKEMKGVGEIVHTEWHGRPNTSVVIIFKMM